MRCWFAQTLHGIGPCEYRPGGFPDPCHLIKSQVVKNEVGIAHTWDLRIIVPGCRRHHSMLDHSRQIRIPRALLPASVEDFAEEFELVWWLDREYGEMEEAA